MFFVVLVNARGAIVFYSRGAQQRIFKISGSFYWFTTRDISCRWGMGGGCSHGWRECNNIDSLRLPCNCPVLARASKASSGGSQPPTTWWCTHVMPVYIMMRGTCSRGCPRYIQMFLPKKEVLMNILNYYETTVLILELWIAFNIKWHSPRDFGL